MPMPSILPKETNFGARTALARSVILGSGPPRDESTYELISNACL